ncbi:MAG: zinc ribbon domain-containing protein [Candidatus Heimdallarchaeota archaeon]|nr:MAG: hypothetical protein DRP02_02640 [Candidatus Gerdarchaeota archaeon]
MPRWRIPGRVIRGVIRRNVRRQVRRTFFRRRARRWLIGGAILLAISGTHRAVKLREEDARRLENHYGRPVEELSEDEINRGIHYYNIQPLTIDESDKQRIYEEDEREEGLQSQGHKYCMYCGALLEKDAKFCSSCGEKV